jgi:chromosome segregation ATPase
MMPVKREEQARLAVSEVQKKTSNVGESASDPLANPNPNLEIQNIRLEKEIKRLRRENARFIKEIEKLNNLIEQMKNIDDDELLMIEKIQTKEIYGKAQKVKISEIQKETEKIRIEIDRLKVINNNKQNLLHKKDTEIIKIREEMEKIKREKGNERVVYKTELRDRPETIKKMNDLQQEINRLRNAPAKIQTVKDIEA